MPPNKLHGGGLAGALMRWLTALPQATQYNMEATEGEMPEGVPRSPWRGRRRSLLRASMLYSMRLRGLPHLFKRLQVKQLLLTY